ncbi:MAG: penicillin-binding protein 1C, partial [Spirochaetes bacterium]|nr:penicillin-binding protein 1C [Spirochaetota bacterium]
YNRDDDGQVNGALSLRQPGSSLKPFFYAYIFSKGHSPSDVIGDIETHIPSHRGDYSPLNYDQKYHGPVSIRNALACSYNIPAVKWLYRYDQEEYYRLFKKFHFPLKRHPEFYGLGLALGTAEITLLQLANAYTLFANKGYFIPYRDMEEITLASGKKISPAFSPKERIFDERIIYLVNHILTDRSARLKAFPDLRGVIYPFDIAFKTGTSKDYRDAWVVGYTKDYIVAVWLGNFKGKSMQKITGGVGAIPIMYDIFLELNPDQKNTVFPKPEGIIKVQVCALSGLLPNGSCSHFVEEVYIQGYEPKKMCSFHKRFYKTAGHKKIFKTFTILPAEYEKWVYEHNIEKPDKEWLPVKKEEIVMEPVRIIFPDDGDKFRIDPHIPREFQKIDFKAKVPEQVKYIEWYLDNHLWQKVDRWQECKWTLQQGNHSIHCIAVIDPHNTMTSDSVNIFVQ